MEIPDEFNNPLSLPYISSMSPQVRGKEPVFFNPRNKFSTNLHPAETCSKK